MRFRFVQTTLQQQRHCNNKGREAALRFSFIQVSRPSKYKYQDGLYYYEPTRHLFIDYLPQGIYVFEYSVRIQHKGSYQTGMSQIQCMYAPEFNSHSQSFKLDVQ